VVVVRIQLEGAVVVVVRIQLEGAVVVVVRIQLEGVVVGVDIQVGMEVGLVVEAAPLHKEFKIVKHLSNK
jgi:hypothetical protein